MFRIQTSNPRISGKFDPDDETLDESVETCFLLNTEMALVAWHGVFIPLQYKYTISTILLDILNMLQTLLDNQDGYLDIAWPSNDFSTRWVMSWEEDFLTIDAEWTCVIGKTEHLLNNLDVLQLSKSEFIFEWKALLEVIIDSLTKCGYSESTVRDFKKLKLLYSRIEKRGVLYQQG